MTNKPLPEAKEAAPQTGLNPLPESIKNHLYSHLDKWNADKAWSWVEPAIRNWEELGGAKEVRTADERQMTQEFIDWWNSNWPDLCPTHIAFHAYLFGKGEAPEQDIKTRVLAAIRRHSPRPTELLDMLPDTYSDIQDAIAEMLDEQKITLGQDHRLSCEAESPAGTGDAREQFEAYFSKLHLPLNRNGEVYANETTNAIYAGWQAGRALRDKGESI